MELSSTSQVHYHHSYLHQIEVQVPAGVGPGMVFNVHVTELNDDAGPKSTIPVKTPPPTPHAIKAHEDAKHSFHAVHIDSNATTMERNDYLDTSLGWKGGVCVRVCVCLCNTCISTFSFPALTPSFHSRLCR